MINLKKISYLSISLAFLIILDIFESTLFSLPYGGAISISTLLFLFLAIYFTKKESIILFILWRILVLFFIPLYTVNIYQCILDYFVAYLGFLICIFFIKGKVNNLIFSSIFANTFRFIIHFISGILYFSDLTEGNIYSYSLIYNLSYILPTILVHIVLIYLIFPFWNKKIKYLKN